MQTHFSKKWIYVTNAQDSLRYALGKKGQRMLLCMGINPSTAAPNKLDHTTRSVHRLALSNGFDGWVMLNVYPRRATNPDDLPLRSRKAHHRQNLLCIAQMMQAYSTTIWAAWGTLIEKRPYLKTYLQEICEVAEQLGGDWKCIGRISKKGHPHHPLYVKSTEIIKDFDIEGYLKSLE